MKPTGFLGPVDSQWLKENKVVGCPHPQVPSGKICFLFVYTIWLVVRVCKQIADSKICIYFKSNSTLLVWMRIYIFEMNSEKETLIYVYGYIGAMQNHGF